MKAAAAASILAGLAACGSDSDESAAADAPPATAADTSSSDDLAEVRLGYFPNVTHAPALVGIRGGSFEEALSGVATLEVSAFNAGPEAVEALFAGAIDASFIGPNPAINAYARSNGDAIRIVAGSTSGGAFLVAAEGVESAEDLRGQAVASPQLGGTQDVALRTWLLEQGLETDLAGGGDVAIIPQANADTLNGFKDGSIEAAWVPEPWATRLVQEAGGHVLVDERDLWPEGRFVTTHLIVSTDYLEEHPDVVKALLAGLVEAVDSIVADPAAAQEVANAEIAEVTGAQLPADVISAAWENLEFTVDPIASSLRQSADDAVAVDLLEPVDLAEIYDLTLLNEILAAAGEEEVEGL